MDVFVSYASEDRDRIAPLIEAIEGAGYSVWWDRRIEMGSSFDRVIERELDAARCVVAVWSEHSIDSEWVRSEATEALERGILVPVFIDDVRPPLVFRRAQSARLVGWPKSRAGLESLLDGIREICDRDQPVPTGPTTFESSDSTVRLPSEDRATARPGSASNPTVARLILVVLLLAAIVVVDVWYVGNRSELRWTQEEAIPRIESSIAEGSWEEAFDLAREVERRTGETEVLDDLWPRFSWLATITSEPAGATVYRRAYSAADAAWEAIGTTPVENVRIPWGVSRIRFELSGYRTLDRTVGFPEGPPLHYRLDTVETLREGKVRVPGWDRQVGEEVLHFNDFFMDRYEVTNREFQRFVDAGGYQRPEFWEHPFIRNGKSISWEDAMAEFTDATGRPGPSGWIGGAYRDGEDDYPVYGVSWYEAAAYAKFMGEQLPTVYHWRRAALDLSVVALMLPQSNLDGQSLAPVGQFKGMSWVGAYDMTGNVREWIFNAVGDQRMILGGAWNSPSSGSPGIVDQFQPPFNRSLTNGFRLMVSDDEPTLLARAQRTPTSRIYDHRRVASIPDAVFEAYRSLYEYDDKPLEAEVEPSEVFTHWTRQRITFDAAYEDEQKMVLYLFLPRVGTPPYQTVVFWPGSFALFLHSIDQYGVVQIGFVLKSGRAVAFPVLKGTFERGGGGGFPPGSGKRVATSYRDGVVRQVQDVRRTIDYLESRPDIDADSLAYYGYSWGAPYGAYVLGVEPRLKVAVLSAGGLFGGLGRPEVRQVYYLPRIRIPVLMLNGTLDNFFLVNEQAVPFFELLGTPSEDKKQVIAEGGHFMPREVLVRETLDWLDKYLGVPERSLVTTLRAGAGTR